MPARLLKSKYTLPSRDQVLHLSYSVLGNNFIPCFLYALNCIMLHPYASFEEFQQPYMQPSNITNHAGLFLRVWGYLVQVDSFWALHRFLTECSLCFQSTSCKTSKAAFPSCKAAGDSTIQEKIMKFKERERIYIFLKLALQHKTLGACKLCERVNGGSTKGTSLGMQASPEVGHVPASTTVHLTIFASRMGRAAIVHEFL